MEHSASSGPRDAEPGKGSKTTKYVILQRAVEGGWFPVAGVDDGSSL